MDQLSQDTHSDRSPHNSYSTQPLKLDDESWQVSTPSSSTTPRTGSHRLRYAIAGALTGLGLSAVLVGVGIGYLSLSYSGRVYPNVMVQGTNLGLADPNTARTLLEQRYASFLQKPLTLTFEGQSWQPTLTDLGAKLDLNRAVEIAMEAGRQQDRGMVDNLREASAIRQHGLELPVALTIDQQQLQQYLNSLAASVERPPTDASLLIDGTDVIVQPSREGRQLLVDETLTDITAALQSLETQTLPVRTRSLPPMMDNAIAERAAQEARGYLRGSLILSAEEQTWEISPAEIAGMLHQKVVVDQSGERKITLTLDPKGFEPILTKISEVTGHRGTKPRLDWNGGNLQIIVPGEPGLEIDREQSTKLLADAALSDSRTVELPFKEVPPQVNESNLHTLGIKEHIATGVSDFSGSAQYRITNIQTGMRLLYGILLAPGEEFSFNSYIGSIDASNGFVEGYAIIANRTQLEYGGGICQDSTTMFRAAFWAGLPITERWGHSFYISWYDRYGYGDYGDGPGMDATIFTGGPDFRFLNDTGHWLLIQTGADPSTGVASVSLYGTRPNRSVEFIGPEIGNRVGPPSEPVFVPDSKQARGTYSQSDTARGGMDIYFSRVIVENGVRQAPEQFVTSFKPWPNIYVHNPADKLIWAGGGLSVVPAGTNTEVVTSEMELEASPTADPSATADPAIPAATSSVPNATAEPTVPATQPTAAVEPEPTVVTEPAPEEPAPEEPAPEEPLLEEPSEPAPFATAAPVEGQSVGN